MRKFYHYVDKRSRAAMVAYLAQHFRYSTMSSWNGSTSYACNLKLYNLGLDSDITDSLYDLLQTDDFFEPLRALMDEFGIDHNHMWQVGMNGRSCGYLVLYQGSIEPSGYKSYCTCCGQKNYTAIAETGNICGVCRKPMRRDFSKTHMRIVTYPGQSTDAYEDFEDWDMDSLRRRVTLIQEFDRLADKMIAEAIYMAKHYHAVEETYLVEKTRLALVERAV